jgi:hypothetical protein
VRFGTAAGLLIVMAFDYPASPPFTLPRREAVTHEPAQRGDACLPEHNDREWIGFANQGGGAVPDSHRWTSNPKQLQDSLGAK